MLILVQKENMQAEAMYFNTHIPKVVFQLEHNVLGTTPEGPLEVLTSRTYRSPSGDNQWTNTKIYDL